MELLKEIKDEESLIYITSDSTLRIREAARAVLFDENNLVPLLFVSKYNYHKLPGGGIEEGEDKLTALIRECLEEVGSEIEVIGEIGKIIEYRSKFDLKQTSYCYYGKVIFKWAPDFTESEINEGFQIIWLSLSEAIVKIENDIPENYEGTFIQKRDLEFLKQTEQLAGIDVWSQGNK